jgi:hypothetical protein
MTICGASGDLKVVCHRYTLNLPHSLTKRILEYHITSPNLQHAALSLCNNKKDLKSVFCVLWPGYLFGLVEAVFMERSSRGE